LLDDRVILLNHYFVYALFEVGPSPVVGWPLHFHGLGHLCGVGILLHELVVPLHQNRVVFDIFGWLNVLVPHFDDLSIDLIVVDVKLLSPKQVTCLSSMISRMVFLRAASSSVKLRLMLSDNMTDIK